MYTLAEKLNNKKIKAYFAYNEEGLLVERLQQLGIQTFRIKMKNPFDLRAAFQLSKLCRKSGIELIHTQYLRENYIALLSRIFNPKVKVIYTNHFVMTNNSLQKLCNRLLTPFNSAIISVCNKGREMLIANGNKASRIKVIFNGVDINYWKTPADSALRKEYMIDDDEFVMLCASRFAHDKGHKYLVESIALLKKMISDEQTGKSQTMKKFRCVLAGDGPLLDTVKQQVVALNLEKDIIFPGFRSDMKNLFNASDIYINSSEHEALSFLIIEALASGLPVIATNMGGNADIINQDTNCGILVEYNNPESLAEGMYNLINDAEKIQQYKQNAYITVEDRFNLDKVVDKTYNLYVTNK